MESWGSTLQEKFGYTPSQMSWGKRDDLSADQHSM
jgi:hypothetical protein